MSKTIVNCSLYGRVRNANGNQCIYTGCSVYAWCVFIEYLLNANNIIKYKYVCYDISTTAVNAAVSPFLVTRTWPTGFFRLKLLGAWCIHRTSERLTPSTLPSHWRSISTQILRTSSWPQIVSATITYDCTVFTNDHTWPGRPTTQGIINYNNIGMVKRTTTWSVIFKFFPHLIDDTAAVAWCTCTSPQGILQLSSSIHVTGGDRIFRHDTHSRRRTHSRVHSR